MGCTNWMTWLFSALIGSFWLFLSLSSSDWIKTYLIRNYLFRPWRMGCTYWMSWLLSTLWWNDLLRLGLMFWWHWFYGFCYQPCGWLLVYWYAPNAPNRWVMSFLMCGCTISQIFIELTRWFHQFDSIFLSLSIWKRKQISYCSKTGLFLNVLAEKNHNKYSLNRNSQLGNYWWICYLYF